MLKLSRAARRSFHVLEHGKLRAEHHVAREDKAADDDDEEDHKPSNLHKRSRDGDVPPFAREHPPEVTLLNRRRA